MRECDGRNNMRERVGNLLKGRCVPFPWLLDDDTLRFRGHRPRGVGQTEVGTGTASPDWLLVWKTKDVSKQVQDWALPESKQKWCHSIRLSVHFLVSFQPHSTEARRRTKKVSLLKNSSTNMLHKPNKLNKVSYFYLTKFGSWTMSNFLSKISCPVLSSEDLQTTTKKVNPLSAKGYLDLNLCNKDMALNGLLVAGRSPCPHSTGAFVGLKVCNPGSLHTKHSFRKVAR